MTVQLYEQAFGHAIKTLLHSELQTLKEKDLLYAQDDYQGIVRAVRSQRGEYDRVRGHLEVFNKQLSSTAHEDDSIDELLRREAYTARFLLDHNKEIIRSLNGQERTAKLEMTHDRLSQARRWLHEKTGRSLADYLEREEVLFSETLGLFRQKAARLEETRRYLEGHERYDHIKDALFGTSAAISATPIGPFELAAIPSWALWLTMREIENHAKNFEEWRRYKKHRLIHKR